MKKLIPLALAGASALVVASPASAANVTIDWKDPSKTTSSIVAGESVTWNVVEGGHNVNVYQGPETFQSTSGKDPKGTQFTHVFNTPGTYQFVCDYHSGMKGTITVASAPPPSGGGSTGGTGGTGGTTGGTGGTTGGSGGSTGATGGGSPTSTGGSSQGAPSAGPAGDPTASGASTGSSSSSSGSSLGTSGVAVNVDPAAPALRASIARTRTITITAGKSGRLIVRARNLKTKRISQRTYKVRAGLNRVSLKRQLGAHRYRLSVVLVDDAGNRSAPIRLSVAGR